MALGSFFSARFSKQAQEDSDDNAQEANMLAGDAILNYRTVASFAQEEKIIKKYEELLEKQISQSMKEHHKAGVAYGFS